MKSGEGLQRLMVFLLALSLFSTACLELLHYSKGWPDDLPYLSISASAFDSLKNGGVKL